MSKESLIPNLFQLFRQNGFDGVSLSQISETTGLGKASLYHHFPKGKEQMAAEVVAHIQADIAANLIAPLRGKGEPAKKLAAMARVIEQFYESGEMPCLCDALTLGTVNYRFKEQISELLTDWIDAIADVAIEAGIPKKMARERAENALIDVQGSLIVSRALNSSESFKRSIKHLPKLILAPIEK